MSHRAEEWFFPHCNSSGYENIVSLSCLLPLCLQLSISCSCYPSCCHLLVLYSLSHQTFLPRWSTALQLLGLLKKLGTPWHFTASEVKAIKTRLELVANYVDALAMKWTIRQDDGWPSKFFIFISKKLLMTENIRLTVVSASKQYFILLPDTKWGKMSNKNASIFSRGCSPGVLLPGNTTMLHYRVQ